MEIEIRASYEELTIFPRKALPFDDNERFQLRTPPSLKTKLENSGKRKFDKLENTSPLIVRVEQEFVSWEDLHPNLNGPLDDSPESWDTVARFACPEKLPTPPGGTEGCYRFLTLVTARQFRRSFIGYKEIDVRSRTLFKLETEYDGLLEALEHDLNQLPSPQDVPEDRRGSIYTTRRELESKMYKLRIARLLDRLPLFLEEELRQAEDRNYENAIRREGGLKQATLLSPLIASHLAEAKAMLLS